VLNFKFYRDDICVIVVSTSDSGIIYRSCIITHKISISVSTRGNWILSYPVHRQHCMPGAGGEAPKMHSEVTNRTVSYA
jgi:hypothetical protein